ncbi:DEAD/DEAH box helicase [Corynebacterium hansenii]|uniref:DEAD/DEAH box helicase n=1 Tax=Corynebacterium hansenii TaxID=394964 RepID=A0ABV7ZQU1_9CORY|nr:DEAD/DEAH box helicase [Corynebacterium hansenii]WJZ00046.1 ski2-like helicase [Corynebacterium hansenii]
MTLLDDFIADLGFAPDDFQLRACRAIEAGRGVLVCAPTGAGKTVVGEFAIRAAFADGGKCFYTTPIKALSNQKYHDLVDVYGEEKVGLLTGDVSRNGDADVVVMTTEVLRNMLYAQSPTLNRLSHVVMDEIHYLADRERGPVWEEVILNLDESVKLVGLSATVSNSEEFGDWLSTVRGHTEVVVTDHRPVPLSQHMLVGQRLYPLFEAGGTEVNRDLLQAAARAESGYDGGGGGVHGGHGGHGGRGFKGGGQGGPGRSGGRGRRGSDDSGGGDYLGGGKFARHQWKQREETQKWRPPRRGDVVKLLGSRSMLPAIVFIFSRAGCEGALQQLGASRMELTDMGEQEEIAAIIDAGVADIPPEDLEVLGFRRWRRTVVRGFAAHHAGMLPAFRHIVEKLFNRGLVKVVFATETLALGINMPARTVVLEKLVKFNGEAHVDLTPGQYTQMTGRAGRRGIDTQGNAVVQWAPAMDPKWVAGLASTRTYPLVSTFTPGYNMSINLLRTLGHAEARKMMEKSFAQFQADGDVVGDVAELERARARVEQLKAEMGTAGADVEGLLAYLELRSTISAEEKAAKRRNIEDRHTETVTVLRRLRRGEVIAIPMGKKAQLAVVVREDNSPHNPRPTVVGVGGFTGRIEPDAFPSAPEVLGRVKVPGDAARHPKRAVSIIRSEIDRRNIRGPKRLRRRTAVTSPELKRLRRELRDHPLHGDPAVESVARDADALRRAQNTVKTLERRVSAASDTLARTFDRVLDLLGEMDYVEWPDGAADGDADRGEPYVSEEGERLARIHNASDLLAAQCLRRGIWDDLDPAELAGAVSTLVFENRRATQGSDEVPTEPLAAAISDTYRIWQELASDEQRHRLPMTRMPDLAFATAVHQWTAGAPLGYCLAAAKDAGAELTPGDFVRWCRQVVDLLSQVRQTGYSTRIRDNATQAVQAIRRGVVALGH